MWGGRRHRAHVDKPDLSDFAATCSSSPIAKRLGGHSVYPDRRFLEELLVAHRYIYPLKKNKFLSWRINIIIVEQFLSIFFASENFQGGKSEFRFVAQLRCPIQEVFLIVRVHTHAVSNATSRVYGHRGQGERDAARVGILNRAAVFRSAPPPPVPLTALCDCANGSNCVCHLTNAWVVTSQRRSDSTWSRIDFDCISLSLYHR